MAGLRAGSRQGGEPQGGHAPAALEDDGLRALPELAAAVRSGRASFDTYIRARFLAEQRFNPDAASRAVYARWREELLQAYQRESGKICGSYYCEHLIAAAARTDRPRLGLVFNSHGWGQEEELLTSCDGLYWEGIDYLAGTDRVTFVERLYAVATDVLAVLDQRCAAPRALDPADGPTGGDDAQPRSAALEALGRKLQDVRDFYAKAAPKRARLRYLAGVAAGVTATVALGGLLLLLLLGSGVIPAAERGEILAIWIGGAVGAVVSVMQRVSSDSLEVHHEAGRSELFLLGAIRPLLGAAVGLALYSLFRGGVLDFALPDNIDDTRQAGIYYFAGIGFLSGFSERFAQDMLVKSSSAFTR